MSQHPAIIQKCLALDSTDSSAGDGGTGAGCGKSRKAIVGRDVAGKVGLVEMPFRPTFSPLKPSFFQQPSLPSRIIVFKLIYLFITIFVILLADLTPININNRGKVENIPSC